MEKGDRYRWLWLFLLLGYKSLMVKGRSCYCQNFHSCAFNIGHQSDRKLQITAANVAIGKPSSQSSYLYARSNSNKPLCGNDGDRTSKLSADDMNCIMTESSTQPGFYMIDLGMKYPIAFINVYWPDGYGLRAYPTRLFVDKILCHTFETSNDVKFPSVVFCNSDLDGQYVKLQRADIEYQSGVHDMDKVINMCELEVWVCWPGYFGKKCDLACENPVCGDDRPCDRRTGKCNSLPIPEEVQGFQAPFPEEKLEVKTLPPSTESAIVIQKVTERPATSPPPAPAGEGFCMNWIYAGCIVFVCTLVAAGIYLFLSGSKSENKNQDQIQPKNEDQSVIEIENQDEVEQVEEISE